MDATGSVPTFAPGFHDTSAVLFFAIFSGSRRLFESLDRELSGDEVEHHDQVFVLSLLLFGFDGVEDAIESLHKGIGDPGTSNS